MALSKNDPIKALRARFQQFETLNPDLAETEREELFELARAVDSLHFDTFANLVRSLITAYLNSPPKREEGLILREYCEYIDRSARLLSEAGQVTVKDGPVTDAERRSVALADPKLYTPLDWCRIVSKAGVPKPLVLARDACQRRNQLVDTVFEHALVVLQLIDFNKAIRWQLEYLEEHRNKLDPDLVRDMLSAWLTAEVLPREALEWAEIWSADDGLGQQWPEVVRRADRLLRNHALRRWQQHGEDRHGTTRQLRLLIARMPNDDKRMQGWLEGAISAIGDCVRFFVNAHARDVSERSGADRTDWLSSALYREIKLIEELFPPLLVVADLIQAMPAGARRFAVSMFGLVGAGREAWEKQLHAYAQRAVRRMFLRDLQEGRTPEDTIRKLTFGDQDVYRKLMAELDWITKQFDSIQQREKVIGKLAVYYASFREDQLLALEVAKRYRNLMRMLHEDNLHRVLAQQQFEEVREMAALRDFSTIVSAARRFLSRHRALNMSLEEIVAAEMDFARIVRLRRQNVIHGLLR